MEKVTAFIHIHDERQGGRLYYRIGAAAYLITFW